MQSNANPFEHLVPKGEQTENPFEHLVPQEVEPTTLSGKLKRADKILVEDLNKLPSAIFESVFKKIAAAPTEVPGYFHQMATEPAKALNTIARGAGNVEKEAMNLATGPDLAALLAHLKFIKPETAEKYFPRQEENLMERFVGKGDTEEGTALLESLPSVAGFGHPIRAAGRLAERGIEKVASHIGNKIDAEQIAKGLGYKRELAQIKSQLPKAERNVLEATTAEEKAAAEVRSVEKAEEEAKSASRTNPLVGSKEVDTIQLQINKDAAKLEDINKKNADLNKELSELKPVEEFKPSETSHIEQHEAAQEKAYQSEESVAKAKQYHEEAKRNAERSEETLGTHLNKEATHDVQMMAPLDKFVSEIEAKSSADYNKFHEELKEDKFQIPEEKMTELEKVNTEKMKDNKYYQALIKLAPTAADTDAAIYFAKFRSFRDAFYKLKKSSKTHGIDAVDRLAMDDAIEALKPISAVVKDTLEKGLGTEYGERLEKINTHFKEKVVPLRSNKIIKSIRGGKGLPKNISDALRVPTPGNELIKAHIKQNPELLKNIIGQRYAATPKKVHKPNAVMQEYINSHPETKALIEQRNKSFEAVKESKKNIETSEKIHAEQKENLKEAKGKYEAKESEIAEMSKENQRQIKSYEGQNKKLSDELKNNDKELDKIHTEQKAREEAIKDLKEKSANKQAPLKQHIEVKKKLDEAKAQLNDLNKAEQSLQRQINRNQRMLEGNKGAISRILTLGKKTIGHIRRLPGV